MSFLGFRLGALVGASCFRRTSTFRGKGALFVLHLWDAMPGSLARTWGVYGSWCEVPDSEVSQVWCWEHRLLVFLRRRSSTNYASAKESLAEEESTKSCGSAGVLSRPIDYI